MKPLPSLSGIFARNKKSSRLKESELISPEAEAPAAIPKNKAAEKNAAAPYRLKKTRTSESLNRGAKRLRVLSAKTNLFIQISPDKLVLRKIMREDLNLYY
jgi:hypothetical protein